MKNGNKLRISLILWMLLTLYLGYNSYKKENIIGQQKTEIKYLKQKVDYLKFLNYPVNMIIITKKSLQCVSSLGGNGFDPWTKYHIKELKPDINVFKFDFALNYNK